MSFSSEFDSILVANKTTSSETIANYDSTISSCAQETLELQALGAEYDDITLNTITHNQNLCVALEMKKTTSLRTAASITKIQALSDTDKEILYKVYNFLNRDKSYFLTAILTRYDSIMPQYRTIINDTETSDVLKLKLLNMVMRAGVFINSGETSIDSIVIPSE